MIIALSLLVRLFSRDPGRSAFASASLPIRPRPRRGIAGLAPTTEATAQLLAAARFTLGDITMLRRELLTGFLVAGFLTVHVPALWWSHLFFSGHGH